jgi:hypothetical protein
MGKLRSQLQVVLLCRDRLRIAHQLKLRRNFFGGVDFRSDRLSDFCRAPFPVQGGAFSEQEDSLGRWF